MVFFPFSAVTRLGASRLRIRQIEEILREHNRHRRDLALGLYGTSVSNMKKLVSFYFFFIKLFQQFGYPSSYIPTICTTNVKMRFWILEKLIYLKVIIKFYFQKNENRWTQWRVSLNLYFFFCCILLIKKRLFLVVNEIKPCRTFVGEI